MKKGFTLIELLTVIIILSLLTLITINVVTSIVKKGKNDINNEQEILIEKAAELWFSDNRILLPFDDGCVYITLQTLADDGYLDDDLYNINTMEKLDHGNLVKVYPNTTSTGGTHFNYEYNPDEIEGCTNVRP